ncbi:MAG: hypothetical protein K8T90_11700 [Planctomycetes bacterium]|nr:hypothetical protein [Planctomycetota bacterium]
MSRIDDRTLALRMLEARGKELTFGWFLQRAWKQYTILGSMGTAALAVLGAMQAWTAFAVVAGMLVGAVARDNGWLRQYRRMRPFSEKVTDWPKVQRLADGETVE